MSWSHAVSYVSLTRDMKHLSVNSDPLNQEVYVTMEDKALKSIIYTVPRSS